MKTKNTFEKLDNEEPKKQEEITTPGEIKIDDFSDTAVGDMVKYNRPDLNGKTDVVAKFQVFTPDFTQEPNVSQSGNAYYWVVKMKLTYESVNDDGIQNFEHISGAKIFRNSDGTAANSPNFWYTGAENQSAYLWEKVAKAKGVEPGELSPREFVAFLNSKPKVKLTGVKYKNYKAPAGAPTHISKNMPESFL